MKRKIFLALALVLALGATGFSSINVYAATNVSVENQTATASLVKNTQFGAVEGTSKNNCNVWYSIPYAAAPTGNLRWEEPQDPASWGLS